MNTVDVDIIKRNGQRKTEGFTRDKLHNSIQAACLSVRSFEGEAETAATRVCEAVIAWLESKSEVTSADLRRKATEALHLLHPEAAYFYQHHRLVI